MSRLSRREFLLRGGSAIAGSMLALPLAERLLLERAQAAPVIAAFPGRLADDLAAIVARLEKRFPYASALYPSQSGISMRRDRNGKRVSEAPFASQGVLLRIFDGAQFHDSAVGSTSADALNDAAQGLLRDAKVGQSKYRILPLASRTQTWRTHMEIDPSSESLDDRLARVDKEFDRLNWNDPRVKSARVSDRRIRHPARVRERRTAAVERHHHGVPRRVHLRIRPGPAGFRLHAPHRAGRPRGGFDQRCRDRAHAQGIRRVVRHRGDAGG